MLDAIRDGSLEQDIFVKDIVVANYCRVEENSKLRVIFKEQNEVVGY